MKGLQKSQGLLVLIAPGEENGERIVGVSSLTGSLPAHEVLPQGRTPVLQGGQASQFRLELISKMWIRVQGKS
jgi:hypothetical protein